MVYWMRRKGKKSSVCTFQCSYLIIIIGRTHSDYFNEKTVSRIYASQFGAVMSTGPFKMYYISCFYFIPIQMNCENCGKKNTLSNVFFRKQLLIS